LVFTTAVFALSPFVLTRVFDAKYSKIVRPRL
jgi:hypothetical protein